LKSGSLRASPQIYSNGIRLFLYSGGNTPSLVCAEETKHMRTCETSQSPRG